MQSGLFQRPTPAAQMEAVEDAATPSVLLGQALRAQATCTAPAGKLFRVISLKISFFHLPPSFISSMELSHRAYDKHSP